MNDILVIKQFLDSHRVHISDEWLKDCIKWCKEEALPCNHNIKDLKEKVFEQWLLLDLRDVEIPSLPPNLSSKQKYTLSGTYFLQIMEILDISKPKYWQIQKIRNETPKNLENENMNSKRALMLTLTDGVQEVKAVELLPIQALHLNLSPGIKIKLMGPLMIRRGRLMLEEHNVKVIGGEVDTILVSHAAENVLARLLSLEVNPNPTRVHESMMATVDQLENTGIALGSEPHTVTQTTNGTILRPQNTVNQNINTNVANILKYQNATNIKTHDGDNFNELDDFCEDEDKINKEIDTIMKLEREMENSSTVSRKPTIRKTPDLFDDMELDDCNFEGIQIPDTFIMNSKEFSNVNQKASNINNKIDLALSQSLEEGMDVFETINVDVDTNMKDVNVDKIDISNKISNLREDKIDDQSTFGNEFISPEKQFQVKPSTQAAINIWPIQKLNKNIPNINNGKFKIKTRFKSIIEKLTVVDDSFHLVVEVEDNSGSITLKFDDEIVASLAGCTATNMMSLKSQVQDNILSAQAKVLGVLKTLKENLLKLDSVAYIHVDAREKYPILISLL